MTKELEQKAKQSFEKYAPTDEDYVVSPYSEDEGRKRLMFNNEYGAEEEYERLYTKGYIAGAVECGFKWHYVKDGDLPLPKGKYEHQNYPQIPCLVEFVHFDYGVRYWNVKEQCWDDEECDDYCCETEQVKRWCYLDDLIKE